MTFPSMFLILFFLLASNSWISLTVYHPPDIHKVQNNTCCPSFSYISLSLLSPFFQVTQEMSLIQINQYWKSLPTMQLIQLMWKFLILITQVRITHSVKWIYWELRNLPLWPYNCWSIKNEELFQLSNPGHLCVP